MDPSGLEGVPAFDLVTFVLANIAAFFLSKGFFGKKGGGAQPSLPRGPIVPTAYAALVPQAGVSFASPLPPPGPFATLGAGAGLRRGPLAVGLPATDIPDIEDVVWPIIDAISIISGIAGLARLGVVGAVRIGGRSLAKGAIQLTGEEFVHVAPRRFAHSILENGLDPAISGGRVYVTKLKYIAGKSPTELESILYNKALRLQKGGYLSERGIVKFILPKGVRLKYRGLTTRIKGVPQWTYEGSKLKDFLAVLGND